MNFLLLCPNSSMSRALALKSVTGRYECSENLPADRKESLKFIKPLDVSSKQSQVFYDTGFL